MIQNIKTRTFSHKLYFSIQNNTTISYYTVHEPPIPIMTIKRQFSLKVRDLSQSIESFDTHPIGIRNSPSVQKPIPKRVLNPLTALAKSTTTLGCFEFECDATTDISNVASCGAHFESSLLAKAKLEDTTTNTNKKDMFQKSYQFHTPLLQNSSTNQSHTHSSRKTTLDTKEDNFPEFLAISKNGIPFRLDTGEFTNSITNSNTKSAECLEVRKRRSRFIPNRSNIRSESYNAFTLVTRDEKMRPTSIADADTSVSNNVFLFQGNMNSAIVIPVDMYMPVLE